MLVFLGLGSSGLSAFCFLLFPYYPDYAELGAGSLACSFICWSILYLETVPPGPPGSGPRKQRDVPSDWREDWQYSVGPRGGRMRRRVRIETRYMRRRDYEKTPDAPEWVWPPGSDYPYFVLGEWVDYTIEKVHPLGQGNWQRIPAPRP